MKNYTIIGAGLVGSLQAIFLAQRGYRVNVFERRPDIRTTNIYQGRSINLALSDRGWKALDKVGLSDEIRKIAIPMYKRTIHNLDGKITYQPYGKENQAIYSVSRGELNKTLLALADRYENTTFHFNMRCIDVDLEKKIIHFRNETTGETVHHAYEYLIGTDGAYSAVRHRLMFNDRFNYSQQYIEHGYKELTIEPHADGTHQMEVNTLHIWPREDFMLIALPNIDGSFTCTLFLAYEGNVSFEALKTERDVISFFQYYFPDVIPMMPDFVEQFMNNPTSSLAIMRCYPWHYKDHVLLMGDAAHAIVPFYGQGMNAGFEDCTIFDEMLDTYAGNYENLFADFGKRRKPDADAIADLALRNFIEMRDLTADPEFLLRKKIEARFSEKYPELWTPLYTMVTFSHMPYSEALRIGIRQDEIMKEVMNRPDIEQLWDSEEIENHMKKLLMQL
jgi:kynurenine 3-monooxygenase